MTRQTVLRILISAAAAVLVALNVYSNFIGGSVPFNPKWRGADTHDQYQQAFQIVHAAASPLLTLSCHEA